MTIKKGDFVEIEYTGVIKEDNVVFDTTDENTAKMNNFHSDKMIYGPIVIHIGERQVLDGLDKELEGKEEKKEYSIELPAEKAFGKKDSKMLKIVPTNIFKKQNINPVPGLQVNIDSAFGIIKTVTGGRTIVDFNHPLAGKDVTYKVKTNRIVTDDSEKIQSFLMLQLNAKKEAMEIKVQDNNAKISFKEGVKIAKEMQEKLGKKINSIIPSLKKIEFVFEKKEKEK